MFKNLTIMKRKINEIIIHCSASNYYNPPTVYDIRRDHIKRGYSDIGYHYIVHRNGYIDVGRPVHTVGAHCKGHNKYSIGICYIGGLDPYGNHVDNRTSFQKNSLVDLIESLCRLYPITNISGHNEYSNRSCPCFDVKKEYSYLIKKIL